MPPCRPAQGRLHHTPVYPKRPRRVLPAPPEAISRRFLQLRLRPQVRREAEQPPEVREGAAPRRPQGQGPPGARPRQTPTRDRRATCPSWRWIPPLFGRLCTRQQSASYREWVSNPPCAEPIPTPSGWASTVLSPVGGFPDKPRRVDPHLREEEYLASSSRRGLLSGATTVQADHAPPKSDRPLLRPDTYETHFTEGPPQGPPQGNPTWTKHTT